MGAAKHFKEVGKTSSLGFCHGEKYFEPFLGKFEITRMDLTNCKSVILNILKNKVEY